MTSGAANQYPTLPFEEIRDLEISRVMLSKYLVYLWVPVPLMPWGLACLDAWGAPYRTALFWRKTGRRGMGFWYRNQMEILLLGVHGVRPFRCSRENVYAERPTTHSHKPDEFYTFIEPYAPRPFLELFATRLRPEWTSVGYAIGAIPGVAVTPTRALDVRDWLRGYAS